MRYTGEFGDPFPITKINRYCFFPSEISAVTYKTQALQPVMFLWVAIFFL